MPRLFALAALSAALGAAPAAADPPVSRLSVLTYNIQDLPWPLGGSGSRIYALGRKLARMRREGRAPDVVVLQEGFTKRSAWLARASGYPFVGRGAGKEGKQLSSGLWILSAYPVRAVSAGSFRVCAGWDCQANKGWMLATLAVPGYSSGVALATTHLNAAPVGAPLTPPGRAVRAREIQIDSFARGLAGAGGAPLIAAGDYNLTPGARGYAKLLGATGLANAAAVCLAGAGGCRLGEGDDAARVLARSLDHHLYRGGDGARLSPALVRRMFVRPAYSDHPALLVEYRIAPPARGR